jgi:lysophospholipase L1-like esterase
MIRALAFASVLLLAVTGCGGRTPIVATPNPVVLPTAPIVPTKAPTVVFIGDSITYNWGQTWASPDFAQHPEWDDQGLVGQNSLQLVDRFQADVVSQHPDIVAILTGTNDVYPGWVLCGGSTVFDTCDNIKAMVAMALSSGIKPILSTIPPWNCSDVALCALATEADPSPARYSRINQLNAWIKGYGAEQGIPVVDYWAALVSADVKTYVPDLTLDGVHPSPQGYTLMTPLVQAAINQAAPATN